MMNKSIKQCGLSLFETILAVMLIGGVIAVLMNVESSSKSSDNNTILAQDISLLLNKSLEKVELDQNATLTVDISGIATYLGVSQSFINSLTGRGLKEYTLTTSLGSKDSGEMGYVTGGSGSDGCDYLYVYVHNASKYTWVYDKQMSEAYTGQGNLQPDEGTPDNIDTTPILPGASVRFQYHHSGGDKIKKYLYLRSTMENHIIGYYLYKDEGHTGKSNGNDYTPDVDSYVQRGLNFTLHSGSDENAKCGLTESDPEEAGKAKFIIFDPVIRKITVDTELSSAKQAKIVASKTYGLIDSSYLSNLDISSAHPLDIAINNKKEVDYTFNQVCAEGTVDPSTNQETPNAACAYVDSDAANLITGSFYVTPY